MRARSLAMQPELDDLVEAAAFGDGPARTRAAGRLMTLLEEQPHRLPDLYRRLPHGQWQRPSLVLGITGAPGTGKSTLVDGITSELRRLAPGRRVGIIAVDPSSPFTGGAVLGDRVRMMRHATDPHVFIRSLATRGHLGGLSLGVKGVLRIMSLIGCDVVVIETVGVGQSEVEIARVADIVAVVLAPGAGDSVQMLKAGLMEVGDLFIINKADTAGADALRRSLLQALGLAPADGAPRPAVLLTSATAGDGVPELVGHLLRHAETGHDGRASGRGARRGDAARRIDAGPLHDGARIDDARGDVRDSILEAARRRLALALDADPAILDTVLDGGVPVDDAVQRLFAEQLNQ
jgi:LAO/AO transport system kinase